MRAATLQDMPALLEIGRKFCATAGLEFSAEALSASLANMIANESCALFITDDGRGVIGGIVYPHFFSGTLVAQELFWWCEGGGLKLLERFEQWAHEAGAQKVLMLCLESVEPERVASLYRRRGYLPLERSFSRSLH